MCSSFPFHTDMQLGALMQAGLVHIWVTQASDVHVHASVHLGHAAQ